jgi:hypothetical protein
MVGRRAQAKERAIHPQRRGQVLDVQDVTLIGLALYIDGEDGLSLAVIKVHFPVAVTRANRPRPRLQPPSSFVLRRLGDGLPNPEAGGLRFARGHTDRSPSSCLPTAPR